MADKEMTFIEHLAELRARIIKALAAVILCSVGGYVFRSNILGWLKRPLGSEQESLHVFTYAEGFFASIKLALYAGILVALPVIFYQILMFCLPALRRSEKTVVVGGFALSSILLYCGVAFSYFLLPTIFSALKAFTPEGVEQTFQLTKYISQTFHILIGFAAAFQVPTVILILVKLRVVTPQTLFKNTKYAFLIIFVMAAFFTPPDVMTQLILAGPLLVLYLISIGGAYLIDRRR